ncbi:MAG: hypothetical protein LBI68_02480, partial [Azoarcus sp.]|nr:hypothetical protein [Azoarcus sp.]
VYGPNPPIEDRLREVRDADKPSCVRQRYRREVFLVREPASGLLPPVGHCAAWRGESALDGLRGGDDHYLKQYQNDNGQ